MNSLTHCFQTSIGKKQIVAVTGLCLIGFVIGHLAGNLLVYLGPAAYNGYAHKLAGLRPGLYLVEMALLGIFLVHMYVTALLVLENMAARPQRYQVEAEKGKRSWATRLMPYTGSIILAFVIWHLLDFTFVDHNGPRSILSDGKSYELYGVLYNAFLNPVHSLLYIIAMIAVGLHLSHGVESFTQTFGFRHPVYAPLVKKFSDIFAIFVTVGFSGIPVYVLVRNFLR